MTVISRSSIRYITYLADLIVLGLLVERIAAPSSTGGEGNLDGGKYHNQGAHCYRSILLVCEFKGCVLFGKVSVFPIRRNSKE